MAAASAAMASLLSRGRTRGLKYVSGMEDCGSTLSRCLVASDRLTRWVKRLDLPHRLAVVNLFVARGAVVELDVPGDKRLAHPRSRDIPAHAMDATATTGWAICHRVHWA